MKMNEKSRPIRRLSRMLSEVMIDDSENHTRELHHSIINDNKEFLILYEPYIHDEWRQHYLRYDALKAKYQKLKTSKSGSFLDDFDFILLQEIRRVDAFIQGKIETLGQSIAEIEDYHEDIANKKSEKFSDTKVVDRTLKSAFRYLKICNDFHKLNCYAITKIAKKFEKLAHKKDFNSWPNYPSHDYYRNVFMQRLQKLQFWNDRCVATFCEIFRESFPELALGELEFCKNHSGESKMTRVYIGWKIGTLLCIVCWILWASMSLGNGLQTFWVQPGLYIYTTFGNILLFRLIWIVVIYIWDYNFVNYLAAFELVSYHPNVTILLNDLATIFLLYGLNFLIYFWANLPGNGIGDNRFSGACPLLLLFAGMGYQSHRIYQNRLKNVSDGLFNWTVLKKMAQPSCVDLDFRTLFCSDVCCSMTRLLTDAARGACWVVSGSFLTHQLIDDYGSEYMLCTSPMSTMFIGLLQLLPLLIRFLQCLRQNNYIQYKNAGKYSCSIIVILYEVFKNPNETNMAIVYSGYAWKVLTVFVVWWWDVKMDFGLWDVPLSASSIRDTPFAEAVNKCTKGCVLDSVSKSSTTVAVESTQVPENAENTVMEFNVNYWGLRKTLMYGSPWIYYAAIVLDFIFRSLWVISFSTTSSSLVGPQLNFLLCTLEITRRCGWGLLRVEKEHIKRHEMKRVGFVQGIGSPQHSMSASISKPRSMHSAKKAGKVYVVAGDADLSSDDDVQPFGSDSDKTDSFSRGVTTEPTPRQASSMV